MTVRRLAIAFGFLTRIPVGRVERAPGDLGRSLVFFPVVGLFLGIVLIGIVWLMRGRMSPPMVAVVLAGVLAALTGGLHLDGLADVFDGLSGSHSGAERMLAIMQDSRIGAHGAVALCLVLIAKVAALSQVLEGGHLRALVLFPAVARWAVVPLIVFFPPARASGLGRAYNDESSATDVMWATMVIVALTVWAGSDVIRPLVAAVVVALAFGVWMHRRLGGLTGDVYGGAIELTEIAFLVGVCWGT